MQSNEYDLIACITIIAIVMAERLSTDELFVLAAAIILLGETLETIAIQRERFIVKC